MTTCIRRADRQQSLVVLGRGRRRFASREPRRIADAPEWTELRTRILSAFEPYPDAVAALLTVLQEYPQ
jgi:hypothetical protein